MKEVRSSSPALQGMVPYDPKYLKADCLMSANESPYDIPDEVRAAIVERVGELAFNRYPDPLANKLRTQIAELYGLKAANVLVGNGGDELLYDLFAAWGGPGRCLMNFPPTFSVYETNAALTGTQVLNCPREGDNFHINVAAACERLKEGDVDIVVVTSPNNPTGMTTPVRDIRRLLEASDALVLVDEAYMEFSDGSCVKLLEDYENLLILRTFSKAYRLAGIRLGYVLANTGVIDEFKKVRQPYSVDAFSQIAGEEVLAHRGLFEAGIEEAQSERGRMARALRAMDGVTVYPSEANFILFKVARSREVWQGLHKEASVLVRDVSGDPRLPGCLRVSVGTPEENDRFLAALEAQLAKM